MQFLWKLYIEHDYHSNPRNSFHTMTFQIQIKAQ